MKQIRCCEIYVSPKCQLLKTILCSKLYLLTDESKVPIFDLASLSRLAVRHFKKTKENVDVTKKKYTMINMRLI
jgi:hypothetical protein